MEQKTKKKKNWLLLSVWIAAAVCLALTAVLSIVVFSMALKPGTKSTEPSTEPEVTAEATVEEVPEETLPILNIDPSPYTAEDFVYDGDNVTCLTVPTIKGIDVSYWQYDIDWQQVKDSGIDFVIIRLAWRGSTEGGLDVDSYAKTNYEGAKAAGLKVGGYFFSQAITPEEAVEEAEYLLEMTEGWEFDMPIVYDWEQTGNRTANMDPRTLTDCAKAFCSTIEDAGLDAMVYFSFMMAHYGIYLEELTDYGFWLAMYSSVMDFPYKVDMWQYTDSGTVPGIEGAVDLNILFEYEE